MVGEIASRFPLEVDVTEVLGSGEIVIAAGKDDGLGEDLDVSIVRLADESTIANGHIVATDATTSRVRVDNTDATILPESDVARIKIVPPSLAALSRGLRYLERGEFQRSLSACSVAMSACRRSSAYSRSMSA